MLAQRARLCGRRVAAFGQDYPVRLRHEHRLQQHFHQSLKLLSRTMGAQAAEAAPPSQVKAVDPTYAERMLKFINYAWTPYHAVGALCYLNVLSTADGLRPGHATT